MTTASQTTFRPRDDADRDAIRALCAATLRGADAADPDDLERVLWAPGMLATVAVVGDAVVGVVVGSVIDEPDGRASAVTIIAVSPAHQRAGVGRALLAQLENAASDAGAVVTWSGGGQPRFWWPGVPEDSDGVIAFFEACGYQFDDVAPNMVVDLTRADLAERPTSAGEIHRLRSEEWPAFAAWMAREWEDPWGDESAAALLRAPVSCHVATRDGRYIGFAAYDTNHPGWFGPMGTSPAARGTGVGAELLRRCLRDYVEQGRQQCEIGWVGPVEFYERTVGATLGRRFVRLKRTLGQARPVQASPSTSSG
ncbi:hypothetical protein BH11ACT4_BH11ACT4_21760 [soil metagenome]